MQKIQVISGHRPGTQGVLIREYTATIRGVEVPHLVNREVLLEGETSTRTYAAQNIKLL